jgi:hypothetical protein
MLPTYKIGALHEHVEARSKSTYRAIHITRSQTLAILKSLPSLLHFTLVHLLVMQQK